MPHALSHAPHRPPRAPLALAVLVVLALACQPEPPAPPRPTSPASPEAPDAALAPPTTDTSDAAVPDTSAQLPVPAPSAPRLPDAEAARLLGEGVQQAGAGGTATAYLVEHAAAPFDVDSKATLTDLSGLAAAIAEHVGAIDAQVAPHARCDVITREALLTGSTPWPWLDRLGARPPRAELERDLDRMGLTPTDQLVNCHNGDQAGFIVLVTELDDGPKIHAFRN